MCRDYRILTYPQMSILCNIISADALARVHSAILTTPHTHPIHSDLRIGNITIRYASNSLIFHGASGFYFRRMTSTDIEGEILQEIHQPREYHCTTYIIDRNDPSIVKSILMRLQEHHGIKLARGIDHVIVAEGAQYLMLVKLSSAIVRHMLMPAGGTLKTVYSGSVESLKQVPTLAHYSTELLTNTDRVTSAIVTSYQKGMLYSAQEFHYNILREVLQRPYLGITIGPIAQWDP